MHFNFKFKFRFLINVKMTLRILNLQLYPGVSALMTFVPLRTWPRLACATVAGPFDLSPFCS
jgi:hypothetical protein